MSAVMRVWTGTTRAETADEYERYLVQTGLPGYSRAEGNLAAYFTRRPRGDDFTEFCLVTVWTDRAAVHGFAGDQIDRAIFYPEDEMYLVEKDDTVLHYDVFAEAVVPRYSPPRRTGPQRVTDVS